MQVRKIMFASGVGLTGAAVLFGLRGCAAHPKGTEPTVAPAPQRATAIASSPAPPRLGVPLIPLRFEEAIDVSTFQKGNIHTHSNWSDGDRPPQDVYLWFRDRGYNFLALTDHNSLTAPAVFRLLERRRSFVMIPGEEITITAGGRQWPAKPLCTEPTIGGHHSNTAGEALAWAVQKVTEQGGVALVNHPNFDWALTARDIPSARGASLLEIFSGHPHVHTNGDETHQSHEAIWDTMLTDGERFAGAAVDDSHYYGARAPDNLARPGRAWIQVFAPEPDRDLICAALAAGRFYSSSGVKLQHISIKGDTFTITSATPDVEVEFIGQGGRQLAKVKVLDDRVATYKLRGDEGYVRARILARNGKRAWTQPARLATASPAPPSPP